VPQQATVLRSPSPEPGLWAGRPTGPDPARRPSPAQGHGREAWVQAAGTHRPPSLGAPTQPWRGGPCLRWGWRSSRWSWGGDGWGWVGAEGGSGGGGGHRRAVARWGACPPAGAVGRGCGGGAGSRVKLCWVTLQSWRAGLQQAARCARPQWGRCDSPIPPARSAPRPLACSWGSSGWWGG